MSDAASGETVDSSSHESRTALVVACDVADSHGRPRRFYNLGAAKLADWLRSEGWTVTSVEGDPGMFSLGFDLVALSVIFSWNAPLAREIALRVAANSDVWCGGPGMAALAHWWRAETGLECVAKVDARFDRQRGDYPFTFAARGCPVGCWFCIVPKIEGLTFTLDWDFRPAPVLCDNNLSALPDDFQDHILTRYAESGVTLKDCNSGFEPRTFTEDTYRRWSGKFKGPWRFAFDEAKEEADVRRVMSILHAEPPRKKQVWVLVGNESVAECYDRAAQILALGGEPWCQFVLPLNWLGDPAALRPRHDWSYALGRDFCRYFNRRLWRSHPIAEYKPRVNEPEPFRSLAA